MKKKNTAKKAVLPALLAVLCSTAALTSVSYAWFTMGKTASVEQIEVNVNKADGLQVTANVEELNSWRDTITVAELKADGLGNHLPSESTKLAPVSSAGKVVNGVQEIFYGELQTDKTVKGKVATAGTDYLMFDLYLKVDAPKSLKLTSDSEVKHGSAEKDSELAARVSFIDLGSVALEGSSYDSAAAKALAGDGVTSAKIWEPNATEHIASVGGNAKLNYQAIEAVASNNELSEVTLTSGNVETFTDLTTEIAALEAGVNKLRVYIWLEGQDADCINEIASGSFATKLGFTVE